MELYGKKSKSIPQKIIIITLEILILLISYWILFLNGGSIILKWFGSNVSNGNTIRRSVIFCFSAIVFFRMTFMMIYLLKRAIPWEESLSVPMAFATYYIGFALLGYSSSSPTDWIDIAGIIIFIAGSFINSYSELQRHFWKQHPENKGKLYTIGLFHYSMHINYFGDLLWVTGYALVTHNPYSLIIPFLLFFFFAFYNIPQLDNYLKTKYKDEFEIYKSKTKKFIPFIF